MSSMVIGICGGSGSGKTTLAKNIKDSLGNNAVLISMDSFYKAQPGTTYEERCLTNYDHPNSIDIDVMVKCLKDLKEGRATDIPVYDFTIHNRSDEPWEHLESAPVILIEGILLFAFPEAVELLDRKIFVDTAPDVRVLRRVQRDINERGRSLESVINQYLGTVRPMHLEFVEPYKAIADIIVPEGGKNDVALEIILGSIFKKM
ncbi:MAG: uridine kinase [Firmicutes bacterium]|nr:uridine kinase [Bacillota bacterium]